MTASSQETPGPGPTFLRLGPPRPFHPVVVAVPHAGRIYPPGLRMAARVSDDVLAGLEDRHADMLIGDAVAAGAIVLVATHARAWIDLNRGERELDPAMLVPPPARGMVDDTPKVRGGLGLVPRRGPGGAELWRLPFAAADVARRIAEVHRPWHAAVAAALADAHARFGVAVLLDLHSMPPLPPGPGGGTPARLVIGDRDGRSAGAGFRACVHAEAEAAGLNPALNVPYAGGYALDRHGAPACGVHALQVEFDRSLYLAPDLRTPGRRLGPMRALVARLVDALAGEALGRPAIAAE